MSEPSSSPFDAEALEAARVFFAHPVTFMMGAVEMTGLPPAVLPEVAFAGRSNVGKSSLINAVTGRNHLARASTAPGRTREINFFVADETLRLVGCRAMASPRSAAARRTSSRTWAAPTCAVGRT